MTFPIGSRRVARPLKPLLARQRMNKSGSQSVPSTSVTQITSWTADATYPATISSNQMTVQGSGACTVTASVGYSVNYGAAATLYLYRNGASVADVSCAAGSSGTKTLTWTGTASAGDTFDVRGKAGTSLVSITVTAATYLELVPT